MEQTNNKRFKKINDMISSNTNVFKKINRKILTGTIIVLIVFVLNQISMGNSVQTIDLSNKTEYVSTYKNNILSDTINKKEEIKDKLITEVSKYIKSQAPHTDKFIPKYIVQAGLSHDIDICFMMAQTQIETSFGTTGAGRKNSRRSLFGVAIKRYSSYENAINDYCIILKKSYLTNGKTEQHLMSKYVTSSGSRYARNPKYEVELKTAYNNIKRTTSVYDLQNEYKKL